MRKSQKSSVKTKLSNLEFLCKMMLDVLDRYDFRHQEFIPYYDRNGIKKGKLEGLTDNESKVIYVIDKLVQREKYKVTLHEMFHAYYDLKMKNVNEENTDKASNLAYQMLYGK